MHSTKEKIIKVSSHLFYYNGYHNTSINDIIKKSNLAKGVFYYHFKSKEDLVFYVIDYHSENMLKVFNKCFNSDNEEKITTFFNKYFMEVEKNKYKGGSPLANLTLELSDENDRIREKLKMAHNKILNRIALYLTVTYKSLDIDKAYLIADLVMNAFEGTILRMKLTKSSEPIKSFNYLIDNLVGEKI